MANSYSHITFAIPFTSDEEGNYIDRLCELAREFAEMEPNVQQSVLDEDIDFKIFELESSSDICVEEKSTNPDESGETRRYMWLYCEEYGDPSVFGHICRLYLKKFHPQEAIAFSWADVCDKPRLDTPQGGAVFATADEVRIENTYDIRRRFSVQLGKKAMNTPEGY